MSHEVPGTPRQQCYDRANIIGPRDSFPADGALYNICAQTGEEFSVEFLRDRVVTPRTAPIMRDVDHQQPKRFGDNLHMPYEDLNGILGLQRVSYESSNVTYFVPGTGYVAEAEKRSNPIDISGHQREHGGASGKLSGKFADDGWLSPERGSPPIHTVELPRSCQCPGRGLLASPSECSSSGKIKFLCSFGGKILPRPNDGKLRYVGGETRILSVSRSISFEDLTRKTCAIWNHHHTIKYQLPGEDLDALISVCSNEDLNLMIEEYQELERTEGSQRLRIFLISTSAPGSPASIEHRVSQPIDADFHYVVAVNGMLSSPRKSSCGHSLTSQISQFGNGSDCSPNFPRETPTAAYVPQMLSPFQLPGKSFNQQPPFSPVYIQQEDFEHNTSPLYVNKSPYDCDKSSYPIVTGNVSDENLSLMENTKSNDTVGHFNNLTQGSFLMNFTVGHFSNNLTQAFLMNYLLSNPYFTEADQNNQPFGMSYQNRSLSSEVASSACGQFDLISESSIMKDWPSHSDIPEEQSNLLSGSSDRDNYCSKMEQSLPDSLWIENDGRSSSRGNGRGLTESSLNIWRPKSPPSTVSSASADWLFPFLMAADVKAQGDVHENLPTCTTTGNHKGEFHQHGGNMNLKDEKNWSDEPGGNVQKKLEENNDAQNNYFPSGILPLFTEIERPERKVSIPLEFPEESPRNLMEQYSHGSQLEMGNSDITIKRQQSMEDCRNPRYEIVSSHQLSPRRTDFRLVAFNNSQEQMLPVSEAVGYATKREDGNNNEKTVTYGKIHDGNACNVPCMQSPAIAPPQENDITSGVPSSLKFISHEDYDVDTEPTYSEQVNIVALTANLEDGVARGTGKESNRPFGDSERIEIEARIYGLQTIKNADLEELRELRSGTFDTVYHGKWRGTDVAIKRIKSSCFSGKPSEQERLVKDFWKEARLLSTLHHPNVVAFYGIVPDGPEGTLATVTEYMVNGSLRSVLLTKKVVLDRRKRLMIAMDAAFGMEYLHMKNIVHFDLKCDNLLVNLRDTERPICKVGDFDLSKIKRNTLVSGGVRGTLPWMAPELLNGNSSMVSEKVDVFSFGITMWEILTGEEPYANLHCGAIIGGIVNDTLRPSIPKRCDAEWKKLMEDCWSSDPSARPSFTDITSRLRNMSAALKKKSPNIAIR